MLVIPSVGATELRRKLPQLSLLRIWTGPGYLLFSAWIQRVTAKVLCPLSSVLCIHDVLTPIRECIRKQHQGRDPNEALNMAPASHTPRSTVHVLSYPMLTGYIQGPRDSLLSLTGRSVDNQAGLLACFDSVGLLYPCSSTVKYVLVPVSELARHSIISC